MGRLSRWLHQQRQLRIHPSLRAHGRPARDPRLPRPPRPRLRRHSQSQERRHPWRLLTHRRSPRHFRQRAPARHAEIGTTPRDCAVAATRERLCGESTLPQRATGPAPLRSTNYHNYDNVEALIMTIAAPTPHPTRTASAPAASAPCRAQSRPTPAPYNSHRPTPDTQALHTTRTNRNLASEGIISENLRFQRSFGGSGTISAEI